MALGPNVHIEGMRETLRAFRNLPKDANKELRARSKKLSEMLATRTAAAARSDRSPQASSVAATVRSRTDRVPVIAAGGDRRSGRLRVPAWKLLFGAEFGANRYKQFHKPHQGRMGSWLFGVAEREEATIDREWNAAADAIVQKWSD